MFCSNCGFQLNDNEKICSRCGYKLDSSNDVGNTAEPDVCAVQEEQDMDGVNTNQTGGQEMGEIPVLAAETVVMPQDVFTGETSAKKKKKLGLWIGLGVAAAIVATIAAIFAFNFSNAKNFIKKTFSSDEEYFKYVHEEQGDALAEELSTVISNMKVTDLTDFSGKMSMSAELSSAVTDLLEEYVEIDLDWLTGADILIDMTSKDTGIGMDAVVRLNEKDLITLNLIADYESGKLYLRVPELNDKYIHTDINYNNTEYVPESSVGALSTDSSESGQNIFGGVDFSVFTKNLPEQKELETLICKYIDLILNNIESVEKENETVEIDGLSSKCTKYTADMNEKQLKKIYEAVLKELKNDEVLENYIKDTTKELGQNGVYDEFIDSVENILEQIDDLEIDGFEYSVYVDSKGEIIAIETEIDSFEIIYKSLRDGDEYVSEFVMDDGNTKFVMSEEGTQKDDIINSDIDLKLNGATYVEIEISDFDTKKYESGELSGSVTFSVGSGLSDIFKMSGDEMLEMLSDMSIKLDCEGSDSKVSTDVTVFDGSEKWLGFGVTTELTETKELVIPSQVAGVDNESEMVEWVKGLNIDKIFDNLKNAGIPTSILTQLQLALYGGMIG